LYITTMPKILRYCGDINHLKKLSRISSMFYIMPKRLMYSLKINQRILKVFNLHR
jgi:hypothetical protein